MHALYPMLELIYLDAISRLRALIIPFVIEITYRPPVPKMRDTPTLRRTDMCRFQIRYTGTLSMAMSEIMLKLAEAMYRSKILRQWPGSSGFQILLRGRQRKIGTKKNMM